MIVSSVYSVLNIKNWNRISIPTCLVCGVSADDLGQADSGISKQEVTQLAA